ncbi:SulP family inorganic anion transporter [Clostridium sardiniense]|uniref:SulP family inorganic anion transporter n=1 Tax=Clostridium sardiniense TaxID=29369 RepID=A0ABS7L2W8_CLOSR|nr:SulP family inorganic anion transporter [Clostridium sardiniense]MDQ0462128.1 SulP family sulfate permease [Clostridium sardiniense]
MKKPKFFSILKHRKKELTKEQIFKDVVAGIIVAIIALPLSIALGISSGVTPEKGLITAIIAGFFISLFGGSRVQIGGPTGAFVVIVYGIIEKYGLEGLIISTLMAGIILILFGIFRLGNLIKYIPKSITLGFTLGIAITLLSTQIKDLFGLSIDKVPSEFIQKWNVYISHFNKIHFITLLIGILCIATIILFPKVNKTIPGSLIALIVSTLIVSGLSLNVETIGSAFGQISSTIPKPELPALTIDKLKVLFMPSLTIAFLAAIESLLSAVVADGMIDKKHNSNTELIGQGIANIASSLFGGIPATGAIARTAANIKNGGRTPIAGIIHAITLLLIMIVFMPLIQYIPLVALAAILAVVSYNMSEWRECIKIIHNNKFDAIELLTTFILTVTCDLVVAILVAMIVHFIIIKLINKNNDKDIDSRIEVVC